MYRKIVLVAFCSYQLFGAVFDTIPTDYIAAKPGIQVISINFLERDLIGPYNKGNKLTNDSISQKTFYLRYNYTEHINDYTSSFGFALPFSKLETKGSNLGQFIGKKSTGISDLVLSSTLWLKNDNVNKEYLGLTFLVSLPTGKFEESQTLNSGENRYKYIINMGYIKPLDERFTLEVFPELAFYGDNKTTNTTIKQKNSYALNTNLRYRFNQTYEVFGGYQYSYNSETLINAVEQENDFSSNKFSLGGFYYTQRYNQFMVRYAKESSKEYGMKTNNELLLRYRW